MNDALAILDTMGRVTFWHLSATRLLGYTAPEIMGRELFSLVVVSARDDARMLFARFAAGQWEDVDGTLVATEIETKDGRTIPVEISLSCVKMENTWHTVVGLVQIANSAALERIRSRLAGKAVEPLPEDLQVGQGAAMCLAEDVALARYEMPRDRELLVQLVAVRTKALKNSAALTRGVLESVGEGIFGVDVAGRLLVINTPALRMLGYTRDELFGKCLHAIIHNKLADGSAYPEKNCPLYKTLATGAAHVRFDEVLWRKDGTAFPVEYTASPMRQDGSLTGAVVVFRDTTERKRTEEALRESEYRLKTILATANEGFCRFDLDMRILETNDAILDIFGVTREAILNKLFLDLTDAPNRELIREQANLRRQGLSSAYELSYCRPDGLYITCLVNASPLYDPRGRHIGSFALVTDITARKQAELEIIRARDAAQAATKAKSDFLANMSHELRTPLNAIRGMTSLALQGDLPPSLRVRLNIIDAASKSLLHIVSEILDFSKTEAGQLQIQREDFQLQDTLASVLSMVESKARDKGLVLHFPKVLDVPGALIGDPQRLGQVLFNLLTNAIKFTPKGEITLGVERVSASKTAVVLRFQIRDTGIGMSKEQMSNLFSPFTQADTSRTRNYGGTGLGLSLCKRLINMMGGEVGVESEPGRGSVCHFTAQFGRHASGRNAAPKVHNEKQAILPVACKMVSDPVVLRASLDALAAFLLTRRPKPCKTALETVAALDWPGPLQENTVELDRLITKYKFKEALAVVEDMQGKLQTILPG